MMMYPHHLQCKVTKSATPLILNLICYRGKNKVALIFSNENVDDDVNQPSGRQEQQAALLWETKVSVVATDAPFASALTFTSSLKNIHRGAKVIVNVNVIVT